MGLPPIGAGFVVRIASAGIGFTVSVYVVGKLGQPTTSLPSMVEKQTTEKLPTPVELIDAVTVKLSTLGWPFTGVVLLGEPLIKSNLSESKAGKLLTGHVTVPIAVLP